MLDTIKPARVVGIKYTDGRLHTLLVQTRLYYMNILYNNNIMLDTLASF